MAKESSGQAASRNQLILIGALVVVLLGAVYFLFLKGDGEDPASDAAPAPAPVTAPETGDDEDEKKASPPKKKTTKGPLETSEVFGGKDPFEPVVDLTADTSGGEATDTTSTDTTSTDTSTDGTSTTDTSTGGTTPTVPTTPTTPTPPDDDDDDVVKTGYSVKLMDVYDDNGTPMALVKTVNRETDDDRVHKLETGDRFRKYFKLTSLNDRCANFLYGDEPFALCVGQRTVRK
ncbi:MAG TPA: hypothetical protein VFD47_00410 [Actinomycetota bacterium]|nr:hypothetical protein [Actinomycetota bacterium]